MKQVKYQQVELSCVMQQSDLEQGQCCKGVLSWDGERLFRFEEMADERPRSRRPKVYAGKFISLVRLDNGGYRIYLKAKDNDRELRNRQFPIWVYTELNEVIENLILQWRDNKEMNQEVHQERNREGNAEERAEGNAEGNAEAKTEGNAEANAEGNAE